MIGKYGQIIINDKKTLLKEISTMLPYTTIHLIGPLRFWKNFIG